MRSIYTDHETEKFITELKEKDPEFNLSSFVKVKLFENTTDSESIVDLSNKLEEAKIKQAEAQAEQEYIRQKIAEVELKQNKEQSSLEQEKKRIDYQIKDRKRNFIIYAPELFKLTKKELENYSQEFSMQDVDIKEFLLKKGKVMKSAPREEEEQQSQVNESNKLYEDLVEELNI